MEEFALRGETGYIKLRIEKVFDFPDRTSFAGGYDCRGIVQVVSGNYAVEGELWFSTGEVYTLYKSLNECYKSLTGEAKFVSTEANLEITIVFNSHGHILIQGYFKERHENNTELKFDIPSDQSYLTSSLNELEKFKQKYGGMTGVKKHG